MPNLYNALDLRLIRSNKKFDNLYVTK